MPIVIHPESHLDHSLTADHLRFILKMFAERAGFFIETVDLPEELGGLPCGLYGPRVGDEPVADDQVTLVKRDGRDWPSRMIAAKPRPSRKMTVIAGPHGDFGCVLFTAYGGPCAPREPGDPSVVSDFDKAEAEVFWAEHALASEE